MYTNNLALLTEMELGQYIEIVRNRYKNGISREHAYRGDLEQLLGTLIPDTQVTNEPSIATNCGNPDFVLTNKGVPIGYIEAKDVGKDLNSKQFNEQFSRYRKALDNLIITDYLWFQFYENGNLVAEVYIGEVDGADIKALPENYEIFTNHIKEFTSFVAQTVKSPVKLAELMAGKARLLENILEHALNDDIEAGANTELTTQLKAFKELLITGLEPKQFADLYAQTLAYGLFAARYRDPTLSTFDRNEAASLIPKSNPLLRNLFQSIAGYNIDERIRPTVDNLAKVFLHADVKSILHNYGKSTERNDPIIHFYETFLAQYDPALRKSRGVWYTPEPVVKFIVRAVDEILKTKFDLKDGLADTRKTKITLDSQTRDRRTSSGYVRYEKEVHKVQILDPATGTGTFLAEVIKHIYHAQFESMQGAWSGYVENDLIPRLNGFEILMASYAMAHLKLDMLLGETGYVASAADPRLQVFLTNSLEEYHPDTHTIFAQWLSNEAREADAVKKDAPVMVVMGNPPYSGESKNKGDWIMGLMDDYKKEPGGKIKLQERNSKWINDDYVKFMRFSQHFIEKNGEGVMAFINAHGFLDNPTFRGMRWHLLKTYDEIYIIDLHGNAKKKEVSPDGTKDENVFDIEQGVSINLLIKTGKKKSKELAKVYHHDLYGKRQLKYDFLLERRFSEVPYQLLSNVAPMYFMVPRNFELQKEYDKGFSLNDLFLEKSNGGFTARDKFTIHHTKREVENTIASFLEMDDEAAREFYSLGKDVRDWKVHLARQDLVNSGPDYDSHITTILYRPFDQRFTYFTGTSKGIHCMPRGKFMKSMVGTSNTALVIGRQGQAVGDIPWNLCFISNKIVDLNVYYRGGGVVFPAYVYPDDNSERIPNLNPAELEPLAKALELPFEAEKEPESKGFRSFAPLDMLDYIYAVLHSPTYRKKYKEFLKTDFPRVPYPSPDTFWQLVELGGQLRAIHLLESPILEKGITSYPASGDNVVTRKLTKASPGYVPDSNITGRVWINDEQYFDNVSLIAWEFYIGGYQPARKWLKDRVGRKLSYEDIKHYQRIIVALTETTQIMRKIEEIDFLDVP